MAILGEIVLVHAEATAHGSTAATVTVDITAANVVRVRTWTAAGAAASDVKITLTVSSGCSTGDPAILCRKAGDRIVPFERRRPTRQPAIFAHLAGETGTKEAPPMPIEIGDRWFEFRRVDDDITHIWEPHVDLVMRYRWHGRLRHRGVPIGVIQ